MNQDGSIRNLFIRKNLLELVTEEIYQSLLRGEDLSDGIIEITDSDGNEIEIHDALLDTGELPVGNRTYLMSRN